MEEKNLTAKEITYTEYYAKLSSWLTCTSQTKKHDQIRHKPKPIVKRRKLLLELKKETSKRVFRALVTVLTGAKTRIRVERLGF